VVYVRVVRYRWLPGHVHEAPRLAQALVASAEGRPGNRGVRVLSALQGGVEGLVVFEWDSLPALEAHVTAVSLERLAPWAVPLLHWRTDQSYEVLPTTGATAPEDRALS
jgi:hypothetical protein